MEEAETSSGRSVPVSARMAQPKRWSITAAIVLGAVAGAVIGLWSIWLHDTTGGTDFVIRSAAIAAVFVSIASAGAVWLRNFMAGL